MQHLKKTKEQLAYKDINLEYDFVKKRALVNFLTNEKLNVEKHFHDRTLNMLKAIQNYETVNLNNQVKNIISESLQVIHDAMNDSV